jgi:hypothetical protein
MITFPRPCEKGIHPGRGPRQTSLDRGGEIEREGKMDKEGKGKKVSIYQYEFDGLLSKIEELSGRLEPIREVYENYKEYMSKINTLLESPATLITHEVWQAIKKSLGEEK